jgi:hypothetical protein
VGKAEAAVPRTHFLRERPHCFVDWRFIPRKTIFGKNVCYILQLPEEFRIYRNDLQMRVTLHRMPCRTFKVHANTMYGTWHGPFYSLAEAERARDEQAAALKQTRARSLRTVQKLGCRRCGTEAAK